MASKSHLSMDQMIRMTCVTIYSLISMIFDQITIFLFLFLFQPTTESLVRQDVNQALKSTCSKLEVKLVPYFYNDGGSKDLLCLHGTVTYQYEGHRRSVPIEIWLQEDHPLICPLAYVKPTIGMEISTTNQDIDRSGNIILPYLKNWSYVVIKHFSSLSIKKSIDFLFSQIVIF